MKKAILTIIFLFVFICVAFANADTSITLTLSQCIEIALKNNPEAAAVRWDSKAAEFRYKQAQAGRLPSVNIETGYNHFLDDQRLTAARYNGEPGDFDKGILRGDLIIKLPIFTGGRIVSEIAAADLLRRAEENKLARTQDELIFNISAIFYSMLGQDKVIESLGFSIKVLEEHLNRVSELLSAQKASRLDYLRTEVRLADLRQNLVKDTNTFAVQKRVLANLLGNQLDFKNLSISGNLLLESKPFEVDHLIEKGLNTRADYLSAKARVEAQNHKIEIAKSVYLPQVNLQASYGLKTDISGDNEDVGTLGITAVIPIFDRKTTPKVHEEKAVLLASQERLRKLELQIRQDIETAVMDINSGIQRTKAIEKAIEQAKESLRIERQKYDLNAGSMTDVLDAQSALLQAETAYYKAMADVTTAQARLDWAIGGIK